MWGGGSGKGIDDLITRVENGEVESLTILSMRNMGPRDAERLALALNGGRCRLAELRCGGHDIGVEGAEALGRALATNSRLRLLSVGRNDMGDEGVRALLEGGLLSNASLEELDLESKSAEDGKLIADLIACHSKLEHLNLARNRYGDRAAQLLAEALPRSDSLKSLSLSSNFVTKVGANHFASLLAKSSSLCELDLSRNSLGDDGGEMLGLNLPHYGSLRTLVLEECGLGPATLMGFAKGIIHSSLSKLDFGGNPDLLGKSDDGVSCFSKGIGHETCQLKWLSLASCAISAGAASALGSHFPPRLEYLDLSRCATGGAGALSIVRGATTMSAPETSCRISELRLLGNSLGDACLDDLCTSFLKLPELKILDLGGCMLSDAAVAHAVRQLKTHPSLSVLQLGGNDIREEAEGVIDGIMKDPASSLDIAFRQG